MRKTALVICLAATTALAGAITLVTGVRYEFTDCSSGGSASQNVKAGTYLFRVTTEDVWICYASTCAAGGEKFPSGTVLHLAVGDTTDMSCRSASSTGDAIFTRGR